MNRIAGNFFIIVVIIGAVIAAVLYFSPAAQDIVVTRGIDRTMAVQRDDLLTDDALRVAICGSGSPLPDSERNQPCNLVMAGGKIFVVDAGSGSFSLVGRWRLPMDKITAVFLTHFHSDHFGDLPIVNLLSWVTQRQQPLAVFGGPGVSRVVSGFETAYALDDFYRTGHHGEGFLKPELGQMYPHTIANPDNTTLTGDQSVVVLQKDGLTITAFAVDHPPISPAYGYRFDYKGRSVVFSGDTVKSASLTKHSKDADVLLHEAMDKDIVGKMNAAAKQGKRIVAEKITHDIPDYHATPADAAQTAQAAGVGQLVLTHLFPPLPSWLGGRVFLRGTDVENVKTRIAHDGMLIELPVNSKEVRFSDLGR